MVNNNLPTQTQEERAAIFAAAQERRNQIIQDAINNGASVNYTTARLTSEEWETHVYWDNDGNTIIDTTIPKDITKCINRGWEITRITYYEGTNYVAGLICKGKSNDISIRKRSGNA